MVDERKIKMHSAEMANHITGAAQFMDSFARGKFVTEEQTCEAMDFLLASIKRNIESCPYASRQEKDEEIHRRESLMNMLKTQMGL